MLPAAQLSKAEVRRRAAKIRRRNRQRPDRTHERLMVLIWFLFYVPLFGTLGFMAMN